ncbi:mucin-15 [Corythoichthys intestinalis]|uniref:mucin-15 n=1 Tax=Corythoichthys intestinalis TaxID=161448 RepID=UPI0025A5DB1E|nr:mucin-15 [Corythoichthys intestinalis]XP_061811209.1 mucin-15-like [Nerophis lumbriciformis]
MERTFSITILLLLLVHTFDLVLLQNATAPPNHTFDPSWLREQNLLAEEGGENGQEGDVSGMETSNDLNTFLHNEDDNVDSREKSENKTAEDPQVAITTKPPTSPNATTVQLELSDGKTNITNTESKQNNITQNGKEFINSTTLPATPDLGLLDQNSTISPDPSNDKHSDNSTTSAPWILNSNENTTTAAAAAAIPATANTTSPSRNNTESTNVTELNDITIGTTAAAATDFSTTAPKSSSPNLLSPETTSVATMAPETPAGNLTDKQASSGSSSERGLTSETSRNKRNEAWGAVLGTAMVVSIVGLATYIILKRRHMKGFSHRKLVEVFPSDPVLRLDNSEPLDLNFGHSAHYNLGVRDDDIQMSNISGRQTK